VCLQEEFKPFCWGSFIAYCPCAVLLISGLLPLFACFALTFPDMLHVSDYFSNNSTHYIGEGFPSINMDYNQFTVEKSPATINDNIALGLGAYTYVEGDYAAPKRTASKRVLPENHRPWTSKFIGSQSQILFPSSEGPEPQPPPDVEAFARKLLADPERSVTAYDQLLIIYQLKNSDNILTADAIARVRKAELEVENIPGYSDWCLLAGGSTCARPLSAMNYFYPSVSGNQLIFDGLGTAQNDISSTIDYLVANNIVDFFDIYFSASNRESVYISSIFRFGLPLPGYEFFYFDYKSQKAKVRGRINDMLPDLEKITDAEIYVIYTGGDIVDLQIADAMYSDAFKALGSLIFIYAYAVFHTQSVFLATFGLLAVVSSFPMAVYLFTLFFGDVMSFLNLMSLWIVLGLAPYDIFLFTDTLEQVPKYNSKGEELPLSVRISVT
jgi:hypothetical protein